MEFEGTTVSRCRRRHGITDFNYPRQKQSKIPHAFSQRSALLKKALYTYTQLYKAKSRMFFRVGQMMELRNNWSGVRIQVLQITQHIQH